MPCAFFWGGGGAVVFITKDWGPRPARLFCVRVRSQHLGLGWSAGPRGQGVGSAPAPRLINLRILGAAQRARRSGLRRFQPQPTRWRCRETSPLLWAGTPGSDPVLEVEGTLTTSLGLWFFALGRGIPSASPIGVSPRKKNIASSARAAPRWGRVAAAVPLASSLPPALFISTTYSRCLHLDYIRGAVVFSGHGCGRKTTF